MERLHTDELLMSARNTTWAVAAHGARSLLATRGPSPCRRPHTGRAADRNLARGHTNKQTAPQGTAHNEAHAGAQINKCTPRSATRHVRYPPARGTMRGILLVRGDWVRCGVTLWGGRDLRCKHQAADGEDNAPRLIKYELTLPDLPP